VSSWNTLSLYVSNSSRDVPTLLTLLESKSQHRANERHAGINLKATQFIRRPLELFRAFSVTLEVELRIATIHQHRDSDQRPVSGTKRSPRR
jgi:hypothetical protein